MASLIAQRAKQTRSLPLKARITTQSTLNASEAGKGLTLSTDRDGMGWDAVISIRASRKTKPHSSPHLISILEKDPSADDLYMALIKVDP